MKGSPLPPLTLGMAWDEWARHRLTTPIDVLGPCIVPVALRLRHFGPLVEAARRIREHRGRMGEHEPGSEGYGSHERRLLEAEGPGLN